MPLCQWTIIGAAACALLAVPAPGTGAELALQQPSPGAQGPAAAGVPCGHRGDVVKMLHDRFGETPIGQGIADTGAKAEMFLSAKGTWTIIATSPNGMSCMVGSGESWQPVVARDDTI